jgi:hypothetical protein
LRRRRGGQAARRRQGDFAQPSILDFLAVELRYAKLSSMSELLYE